jgi:hypothetical protein
MKITNSAWPEAQAIVDAVIAEGKHPASCSCGFCKNKGRFGKKQQDDADQKPEPTSEAQVIVDKLLEQEDIYPVSDEEGTRLGLTKRETSGVNAAHELGKMAREVNALKSNPQVYLASLEKHAQEDIERLGYWRLHPSVGHQLHQTQEVRVVPSDQGVDLITGQSYWGEQPAKGGKKLRSYPSLRAAIASLYGLPESNPVSYGKAIVGNPVKGSNVEGNAGTPPPITGVGSDRKFTPAKAMVQRKPEDSEVKKQTKRKVTTEAGPPVPPPPPEESDPFEGAFDPWEDYGREFEGEDAPDKTEELAELWREDQAGEYIQINPDDSAYYIAHRRAIEQIAPPRSQQRASYFVGGDPRKRAVSQEGPAQDSQTFKLIRAWMAKNNYSPNIWAVNDHGNVELYDHNGKALGGLV